VDTGSVISGLVARLRRPLPATVFLCLLASLPAWLDGGLGHAWAGLCVLPIVVAGYLGARAVVAVTVAASAVYVAGAVATTAAGRGIPWPGIALQIVVFALAAVTTVILFRRRDSRGAMAANEAAEARNALDVQHMINAAYDIDVTMDMVVLKMRELARADFYAVFLTEGNFLRLRACSGLPAEARDLRLPLHAEDHGWTPTEGRPLVIEDIEAAPSCFGAIDSRARSLMLVPLQSVERLVGLLYFGSREANAFGPRVVDLATTFANQVVFPVQRAILEEELKRLAYTDTQTSLYNHRHFQAQLDEEVRRAQRYSRPMALMMLDIDDFKQLNDRYGHPAGDAVLRDIAGILRSSLRSVDVPARYGGEEFAIVCPETTKEQATVLAERLRARIEDHELDLGDGTRLRLTVSIGVAAFPADAGGKSDLIDAADRRLYEAKRGGKNRVQG
jgi:diguanylate cyclase (GGDEF)-like protein